MICALGLFLIVLGLDTTEAKPWSKHSVAGWLLIGIGVVTLAAGVWRTATI